MTSLDNYCRPFTGEEINALPLRRYEGDIRVFTREDELMRGLEELNHDRLLGFDTETRPVFRKGKFYNPALIQLACEDRVLIFQISQTGLSPDLAEVLADAGIVKAGVAVRDDLTGLKRMYEFEEAGFVDLGEVAHEAGLATHGLRNLAANLLGFRISKGAQCSNWGKPNLSHNQIVYAATDAWVSREIYLKMIDLGLI